MILNDVPNILYNGEPVSVWCNGLKIWPIPSVYFTVTSNDYQGVQVGLSAYDKGSLVYEQTPTTGSFTSGPIPSGSKLVYSVRSNPFERYDVTASNVEGMSYYDRKWSGSSTSTFGSSTSYYSSLLTGDVAIGLDGMQPNTFSLTATASASGIPDTRRTGSYHYNWYYGAGGAPLEITSLSGDPTVSSIETVSSTATSYPVVTITNHRFYSAYKCPFSGTLVLDVDSYGNSTASATASETALSYMQQMSATSMNGIYTTSKPMIVYSSTNNEYLGVGTSQAHDHLVANVFIERDVSGRASAYYTAAAVVSGYAQ